jgi:hypothetical protein
MQIVCLEHQVQLLLTELFVHERQGQAVEGQVPGGVPGVFPLVRHGDHVGIVHVVPVVVARRGLARRLERVRAAFLQPLIHIVVVELLAPQHAGQGLPHNIGFVCGEHRRDDGSVEGVSFLSARLQRRLELAPERTGGSAVALGQGGWRHITEPE